MTKGEHAKKAILVCEVRQGKLLDSTYELLAFADRLGVEKAMLLIGSEAQLPNFDGKVYLADSGKVGEYNPDLHKQVVLDLAKKEQPDYIVFLHSSFGWDLAPRVAAALKIAQISEIVGIEEGMFEVPAFNAKMRRLLSPKTAHAVLTIQAGAFSYQGQAASAAQLETINLSLLPSTIEFLGYEAAEKKDVELDKAEVIVSAGRGIGKKEESGENRSPGKSAWRRTGSHPASGGCWLGGTRPPGRQQRPDRRPKTVYCMRHLRGDPTYCRDEEIRLHRGH